MIIFAAIFFVFIIALSVFLTKDKYNMFLISNIMFLTTTFLFPFLGQLFGLDILMTVEGTVMYVFYFFIFFLFYIVGRKSVKQTPFDVSNQPLKIHGYVYVLLIFSLFINLLFVAYSVASYGVQGAFINPREVYTQTRQGTGQIYYVAAIFFNLYVILGLMVFKRKWLHFLFCVFLCLPYGTKGKILQVALLFIVYYLFVNKKKIVFRKPIYLIIGVIVLPTIILISFWYTSIGLDTADVIRFTVSYGNEYENNFHELVMHFDRYFPHGHLNGKILFGDTIYPYIPRVLWPGKPEYFGDLYLSYIVYPDATLANVGAPSFGALGQPYADFGFWGGMVQVLIEQSILGYLLGRYEIKCLNKPSITNFLLLITLSLGGLIGISGTNRLLLIVVNLIFLFVILYPLKINFRPKRMVVDSAKLL